MMSFYPICLLLVGVLCSQPNCFISLAVLSLAVLCADWGAVLTNWGRTGERLVHGPCKAYESICSGPAKGCQPEAGLEI